MRSRWCRNSATPGAELSNTWCRNEATRPTTDSASSADSLSGDNLSRSDLLEHYGATIYAIGMPESSRWACLVRNGRARERKHISSPGTTAIRSPRGPGATPGAPSSSATSPWDVVRILALDVQALRRTDTADVLGHDRRHGSLTATALSLTYCCTATLCPYLSNARPTSRHRRRARCPLRGLPVDRRRRSGPRLRRWRRAGRESRRVRTHR